MSDPGNFLILWNRSSPTWRQTQGLSFKIREVRYWIQTSCLHSSGRQCLTDCCQPAWLKQAEHSNTCTFSSSLQLPLLRRYKLPTTNTPNELFTKIQQKSCATWRVFTLEWLTKIAAKILNTIWKLRRSFGPTRNDSNLNWIFTV
jgi:hypothetical protein